MEDRIFNIDKGNFTEVALDVFRFQAVSNPVYAEYLRILKVNPGSIQSVEEIPFLPISFFKTHRVCVEGIQPEAEFTSSGTSGVDTSKHFVALLSLYERSFLASFRSFYGDPSKYCILALLPLYLERKGSSLVYMVSKLIEFSHYPQSGFFLNNFSNLVDVLGEQERLNKPTILLGVTFALLELARDYRIDLKNTVIMETGGMKGRGKELIRAEAHQIFREAFGVNAIHSEYGMTELMSQAYSLGDGVFECPPWMRVAVRDPYDPFSMLPCGRAGALNIIDLANLYSCAFIQTDDLGIADVNGGFKVLGRMDGSQLRGCNLLVTP